MRMDRGNAHVRDHESNGRTLLLFEEVRKHISVPLPLSARTER
jgi:hypothetical protein